MKFKENLALQQKLAAEYVLGTLRGGARRRFETWMRQDAALQQVVREWQGKLMPMAEFSLASKPAVRIWLALEKRLKLQGLGKTTLWEQLRDNLTFWRGLGIVSSSMALAMVFALVLMRPPIDSDSAASNYVATLSDEKAQPIAVVSGDIKRRQLAVRFIAPPNIAADKSLELWAINKNGKVKSLGLIANYNAGNNTVVASAGATTITLAMPEDMSPDTTPLLAISLEPKGGSGNPEKPSGPIVFKGNWLRLS
jgi:anti-sigma-K factor RskA